MSGGYNASGSKRYYCKLCKKWYTPVPTKWVYTESEREQALRMIVDGCTGRGVGRQLKMSKANAYRWAREAQKRGILDVDKS